MDLNILYTTDHNYSNITPGSILSTIMNNKNCRLHFHVITADFEEEDYRLLKAITEENEDVDLNFYDFDNFNIEDFNIPSWRGTQIANARLFFQDIIETSKIDKLLYLDSDTIILDDLMDILNCKGTVGAVPETVLNYRLKELGVKRYFNSGVLLLDICKWIEGDYQRKITDYRKKNPNLPLKYSDQDLLNVAIGEEITELPYEYNMPPYVLATGLNLRNHFYNDKRKYNNFNDVENKVKNAKIYHCCGFAGIKPWAKNNVNPFNEEFDKYMEIVNPNLNKEKLSGAKRILAEHKTLLYLILYMKNVILPENVIQKVENIQLKRK